MAAACIYHTDINNNIPRLQLKKKDLFNKKKKNQLFLISKAYMVICSENG